METRLLEIFVEAADAQNFRLAAQRLGIAQPAVTQRIRQFEAFLGFSLFHRINRGVELTPAGHAMLLEAKEILARTMLARERAKQIKRGEVGEIRIGFGTSVMAEEKLPKLIRDYMEAYPRIRIELAPGTTMREIIDDVEAQETDFAFVRAPILQLSPHLRSSVFNSSPLYAAFNRGHPLSSKPSITLVDIAEEKLLLPVDPAGLGLSHSALSLFEEANIQPSISMRVSNITAILGLVAVGSGIAILPREIALSYQNVKGVPLQETDAESLSMIVYRRGTLSLHLQNFLQMAQRS